MLHNYSDSMQKSDRIARKPAPHKAGGFTLIEMSIVLVIIGLLVGGVLVGQDLIRAAQVRKTGTLIEQLNTAVNTFKLKYNCLPGDCANASDFSASTDHAGTVALLRLLPPATAMATGIFTAWINLVIPTAVRKTVTFSSN
jgi:prepilin-type N-terminal cleavage/methylation domain-containing protein